MNIREKLKYIEAISSPKSTPPGPSIERPPLDTVLDGTYQETPFGSCFVMTTHYPLGTMHGRFPVRPPRDIEPVVLERIGKSRTLSRLRPETTLFFDTETTGLSSGTGTHIFLAGFGYFEDNAFVVRQYFLIDYDEERALLAAVNSLLGQYESVISYNGKTYDWPLLQTRFVYSRMSCALTDPIHLDLLHPARRIWKQRLPDCSLQQVEASELGFVRERDIPCALIPQVYFEYLRGNQIAPLKQVFQHNVWDIISMAVLFDRLAAIHADPMQHLDHAEDLLGMARLLESRKEWGDCVSIYQQLLDRNLSKLQQQDVMWRLSMCCKRMGDWNQAATWWEQLIAAGAGMVEPYVELAKYYEHRLGDFRMAETISRRALEYIGVVEQLRMWTPLSDHKPALLHRIQRNRLKQTGKIATDADDDE